MSRDVPRATPGETVAVVARVLLPLIGRGLLKRRPRVVALGERLDLDRAAVRTLQRLRRRHGRGPVLLRLPWRDVAFVLDPDDARRVLDGSPEPFATANLEKRAALAHFQPHGVLTSHGHERAVRRTFNEDVLDFGAPVHRLGAAVLTTVREELGGLVAAADADGVLTWDAFLATWDRLVRRLVLGDGAADDQAFTDLLRRLRGRANSAYLVRHDEALRRRFRLRLEQHLARAEPGSLAEVVAAASRTAPVDEVDPAGQVPQWLFAFEPAGFATYRALALLTTHPAAGARARDEIAGRDRSRPQVLPELRSAVLESLRLWPTTPAILRDTTEVTRWADGRQLPAGAAVVVFAPYLHRDDRRLPFADRFAPEIWGGDVEARGDWPLVPFSAGPGTCPGRDLVLFVTTSALAELLADPDRGWAVDRPLRRGRLPSILDVSTLAFVRTSALPPRGAASPVPAGAGT